jgi:hypothetical protein
LSKISEHKIEQFIRFSYELSREEKEAIKREVETSEEAQKIFQFLSDYYEELDKTNKLSAHLIPLNIFKEKQHPGPVVLAAMSTEIEESTLTTKATLVSEEHKTLVRILENRKNKSLQFHVIGEDIDRNRHAILSLVQQEIDLVTDQYGKLKGVQELSDIKWDEVPALLRLPVDKCQIHNVEDGETLQPKKVDGFNIRLSEDGQEILIDVENAVSNITRILMTQGAYSELRKANQSHINFTRKQTEEEATLYFYE